MAKKIPLELLYTKTVGMHTLWDIRHNGNYVNPRNLSFPIKFLNWVRVWVERKVQKLVLRHDIYANSPSEQKELLSRHSVICKQEDHTYLNSELLEQSFVSDERAVSEADKKIIMPPEFDQNENEKTEQVKESKVGPLGHLPTRNASVFRVEGRGSSRERRPKPGEILETNTQEEFEEVVSSLKEGGFVEPDTNPSVQEDDLDTTKY